MEAIFKEEEIKKYIDDYYALYYGNGENITTTIKEAFEMGFRTGMVKALYEKHDDENCWLLSNLANGACEKRT